MAGNAVRTVSITVMLGPVLSPPNPQSERALRLMTAAENALGRIAAVSGEEVFGPLGETLLWLVAIDDLLASAEPTYRARRDADPDAGSLLGLRYARNAVVHGERVTATTYVKPGAVLGAAMLGTFALGEGPSIRWIARALIKHTPRATKYLPSQEQSYDRDIAGRDLYGPLREAFDFLRDAVG